MGEKISCEHETSTRKAIGLPLVEVMSAQRHRRTYFHGPDLGGIAQRLRGQ
jgi:hypothetical protein